MAISFQINGKIGRGRPGQSILNAAEDHGINIPNSCSGQGKCRECVIEITDGISGLSTPSVAEAHLEMPFRLACQCELISENEHPIKGDTLNRGAIRITETGQSGNSEYSHSLVNPAITRREGDIFYHDQRLAKHDGPVFGLAIDLGTTTVVVRLHDLETGIIRATRSFENPQRFGGSDVLARVKYDTDHPGKLLQRTLVRHLSETISSLPVDPGDIFEIVIAANTAMRDLFFGMEVECIGQYPYRSITEKEFIEGSRRNTCLLKKARGIGLRIHPEGLLYGVPLIGSHVGGDAASCLTALDHLNQEDTVVLMDIGTNTELIMGNRNRIVAASCPAGPAFEGGALSCGLPAVDGAIEEISIGDSIELKTIGNAPPRGICGSGLVSALSECLRVGWMNELGRLTDDSSRFQLDSSGNVSITEEDISLIAQAKAANVAGLHLVTRHFGISLDDISRLLLAGSFAGHMNIRSACRIGLLPDLPADRFECVGNASIEGASRLLLDKDQRRILEQRILDIEHVELESFPEFFHFFAEGVQFKLMKDPDGEIVV